MADKCSNLVLMHCKGKHLLDYSFFIWIIILHLVFPGIMQYMSTYHILTHSYIFYSQIAFLETFWDSDEPRFGEKNAKGWSSWMNKKEKGGWEEVPPQNIGR